MLNLRKFLSSIVVADQKEFPVEKERPDRQPILYQTPAQIVESFVFLTHRLHYAQARARTGSELVLLFSAGSFWPAAPLIAWS